MRRSVVAATIAFALVALTASPAAGDLAVVHDSFMAIGSEIVPLPGDGDEVGETCTQDLPDQTLDIGFPTGDSTSGTWTASGTIKGRFRLAPPNHLQLWQADITVNIAGGPYSSPGPSGYDNAMASAGPNHIVLTMVVHRLTEPDCVKDDVACILRARVLLTAGSGVDGAPTPTPGDAVRLNFSANPGGVPFFQISSSCASTIQSAFVGQHPSGTLLLTF